MIVSLAFQIPEGMWWTGVDTNIGLNYRSLHVRFSGKVFMFDYSL